MNAHLGLVILDAGGRVLTTRGVEHIASDPLATRFPYHYPNAVELLLRVGWVEYVEPVDALPARLANRTNPPASYIDYREDLESRGRQPLLSATVLAGLRGPDEAARDRPESSGSRAASVGRFTPGSSGGAAGSHRDGLHARSRSPPSRSAAFPSSVPVTEIAARARSPIVRPSIPAHLGGGALPSSVSPTLDRAPGGGREADPTRRGDAGSASLVAAPPALGVPSARAATLLPSLNAGPTGSSSELSPTGSLRAGTNGSSRKGLSASAAARTRPVVGADSLARTGLRPTGSFAPSASPSSSSFSLEGNPVTRSRRPTTADYTDFPVRSEAPSAFASTEPAFFASSAAPALAHATAAGLAVAATALSTLATPASGGATATRTGALGAEAVTEDRGREGGGSVGLADRSLSRAFSTARGVGADSAASSLATPSTVSAGTELRWTPAHDATTTRTLATSTPLGASRTSKQTLPSTQLPDGSLPETAPRPPTATSIAALPMHSVPVSSLSRTFSKDPPPPPTRRMAVRDLLAGAHFVGLYVTQGGVPLSPHHLCFHGRRVLRRWLQRLRDRFHATAREGPGAAHIFATPPVVRIIVVPANVHAAGVSVDRESFVTFLRSFDNDPDDPDHPTTRGVEGGDFVPALRSPPPTPTAKSDLDDLTGSLPWDRAHFERDPPIPTPSTKRPSTRGLTASTATSAATPLEFSPITPHFAREFPTPASIRTGAAASLATPEDGGAAGDRVLEAAPLERKPAIVPSTSFGLKRTGKPKAAVQKQTQRATDEASSAATSSTPASSVPSRGPLAPSTLHGAALRREIPTPSGSPGIGLPVSPWEPPPSLTFGAGVEGRRADADGSVTPSTTDRSFPVDAFDESAPLRRPAPWMPDFVFLPFSEPHAVRALCECVGLDWHRWTRAADPAPELILLDGLGQILRPHPLLGSTLGCLERDPDGFPWPAGMAQLQPTPVLPTVWERLAQFRETRDAGAGPAGPHASVRS